MEPNSVNNIAYVAGIFRKIMVHAVGDQTQNVSFVKTGFTHQVENIQYSVTSNGPLNNSGFNFHAKVVKVTYV